MSRRRRPRFVQESFLDEPPPAEPASKPRSRRRVIAHHNDAGESGVPGYKVGGTFRCDRCGWESEWLAFKTDTEFLRGVPCERCNPPVG
jgi:hypothetical protein